MIYNVANGHAYVGSAARGIQSRWRRHRHDLRHSVHHSRVLQRAWSKYGEQSFVLYVIEEVEPEKCIEREQFWIDIILPPYNICKKAGSSLGTKRGAMSEENRMKISTALVGREFSSEHREALSEAQRRRTKDSHLKSAAGRIGKKLTEEHKQKLSQAKIGRPPHNKGKKSAPLSEEHKRKIAESMKAARRRK